MRVVSVFLGAVAVAGVGSKPTFAKVVHLYFPNSYRLGKNWQGDILIQYGIVSKGKMFWNLMKKTNKERVYSKCTRLPFSRANFV